MTKSKSSQPLPDSQRTRRYLNRSALLSSIVGLAVLAGAGYLWYRYSLSRNAKMLHDYAEQCAEKRDYTTASAQFARYVQFCPDDVAARVRLAETYDLAYSKLGRVQRTIELYREALGAAPEAQKASIHSRLGELLLEARQFLAAADEADAVLKGDPKNIQAANLRAMALFGQARQGTFKGKPGDVGTGFETALSQDPGNRDTAVTLAQIYREEPQYLSEAAHGQRAAEREKAADQIIDRLVAAHPDQPEVFLARYQYRRQYHLPGTDQDLKEARRLGPENLDVLLASAEALRLESLNAPSSPAAAQGTPGSMPIKSQALREEARAAYEKAIAIAGSDYRGYFGLGETLMELGQSQAAIDAWKRGLKSAPTATIHFEMLLADGLIGMGRLDEAETHINQLAQAIEKLDASKIPAEKAQLARRYQLIRATWLRGKSQPFQAIALARAVATGATVTSRDVGLSLQAWSLLADIYSAVGRWAEAADAFEKAVELAPKSPRYRTLAAKAWLNANYPDRAVRALRLALAFDDGSEVRLALVAAIFRQTVAALEGNRDWQAVQAALADVRLAQVKQPLKEPWRLALLEAEIALVRADAEGRHADGVREAVAIYRRLAGSMEQGAGSREKDHPAPNSPLTASPLLPTIAMALDRLGQHDDAERTLAQWEKTVAPGQARMLRAYLAASRKKFDEARSLVQAGLGAFSPAERSAAQRFLIQLSLAERDGPRARAELDALTDFGPRDLDLLSAYAELTVEQKQAAEVERCRQKFIEIEGADSRYGQLLRASNLLAQIQSSGTLDLREAHEVIDVLTVRCPDWPPALLLRAHLLEVEGSADEAANAYAEAIRFGAAGAGPYERLIDLLSRAGRNAEAESYLDALRQQSTDSEGAENLEAQLLARRTDREKALEIIRREAQQHPANGAIQLSLGQLLAASGQSTQALAALRRAVDLAPDNLQAIHALAVCLIECKQADEARQVVAKLAGRKDLPEVQKQLAIAQIDEILDDKQAARDHYQAACDVSPHDPAVRLRMVDFLLRSPRKEDAAAGEQLLRAIVLDSPHYVPARRSLAAMLAQRGGEEPWKEARGLLHDTPGSTVPSVSNRQLDALLLFRRGGAANRQQARQILNELVLRHDADINDRMFLARLEDEDGRAEQARTQYEVVASHKDPRASCLQVYADFLLRHGPAGEADIQIRRLEKISADDPASLALRVRWLHAQHRDAEVGPLVEAAAQRRQKASGASSAETARNCIAAGGLYELCDQYAAAERWYRRLLEVQPDNFEPLAVMLAKQKRGAEAVNVCLDAAKRSPSARPAIAVCAMRAARRIDEKEFQAAQSLVAAAEKDKPEAKFLVMLAAVRIVQERADEAIALYRQALTAEPQYVEALNNLATLLGEQPGHAQEALEFIDRAVSLAGPQGWLLETRGEILLGAGRVEEALPLVVEAASSAQPDPRVLLHLAKAYCMAGKLDQARKALDDARKRNLSQHMLTPAQRKLIQELDEKLRG